MTSDVQTIVHKGLGRVTLNRPKAINSLTHDMVREITAVLDKWAGDDAVRGIVVDGAGERGLCAGGDIRSIYDDARNGGTGSLAFWADEYRMNARIGHYPKPYVALMDGLVMGGGVGISSHGSHRVVTDRTKLGMPEVGIGFVPDVGGLYRLSRAPGEIGTHMALTGAQFSGADAMYAGFADRYAPSEWIDALRDALGDFPLAHAIAEFTTTPPPSSLERDRRWIDECYSAPSIGEILERLRDSGEAARAAAAQIETKSPTALTLTLRALRDAARADSLDEVLAQDLRISARCLRSPDFAEGIRAQIVDKDRNPVWAPSRLAEIDEPTLDEFFADLGEQELRLDQPVVTP